MDALSLTIEAEMLGLYQPPPPVVPRRGKKAARIKREKAK